MGKIMYIDDNSVESFACKIDMSLDALKGLLLLNQMYECCRIVGGSHREAMNIVEGYCNSFKSDEEWNSEEHTGTENIIRYICKTHKPDNIKYRKEKY